jgi:arylsulfatase A-like enzyme
MYVSDNGYAFGEHRLRGKGHLFEESVRVPLLVRGPGIRAGRTSRLTNNIDLTPTILDWAGVAAPPGFPDGRSFAAHVRGEPSDDPTEVLFHGCRTGRDSDRSCGGSPEHMGKAWAVRTDRYKYIEYEDGSVQLFDLHDDPCELTNLAPDAQHIAVVAELAPKVARLREEVA